MIPTKDCCVGSLISYQFSGIYVLVSNKKSREEVMEWSQSHKFSADLPLPGSCLMLTLELNSFKCLCFSATD